MQAKDVPEFMHAFTFIVPMTLEIFLPCYFGNELSIASGKLSQALFHSEWIENNKNLGSTMKIFMENMKKETKISAFGIFHVNLTTFNSILNSAYSLFAVLKRVNNK
jgi:odorant receptor